MAFVLYKHLGSYLSTENASMKFSSETLNTNYSVIVNSPIITAAINKDSNKVYLSDPVIFTVRHIQVRSRAVCVAFTLRFVVRIKYHFSEELPWNNHAFDWWGNSDEEVMNQRVPQSHHQHLCLNYVSPSILLKHTQKNTHSASAVIRQVMKLVQISTETLLCVSVCYRFWLISNAFSHQ